MDRLTLNHSLSRSLFKFKERKKRKQSILSLTLQITELSPSRDMTLPPLLFIQNHIWHFCFTSFNVCVSRARRASAAVTAVQIKTNKIKKWHRAADGQSPRRWNSESCWIGGSSNRPRDVYEITAGLLWKSRSILDISNAYKGLTVAF